MARPKKSYSKKDIAMYREVMQTMFELNPFAPDSLKPPKMMSDEEIVELLEFAEEKNKEVEITPEEETERINNSPYKATLEASVQKIAEGLNKVNLKGKFEDNILYAKFEREEFTGQKVEFFLTVQHGAEGILAILTLLRDYDWSQIEQYKKMIVKEDIEGNKCYWDVNIGNPVIKLWIDKAYEAEKASKASDIVNKFITVYTAKLAQIDADINNAVMN